MPEVGQPARVSLLVVCKDSVRTIRRCLESLLRQDYAHVRIVVQDGASTDGTLEVLRGYGDRLDLVSEPDADQNEGFVKGLQRCDGDLVGFCWADEELLPHATRWAVEHLTADPALGAVYGDFIETDLDGHGSKVVEYPAWDFGKVFAYEFIPPVCASFFRREALAATYLTMWDVALECTEYVLWVSVGSRHPVRYVPGAVAKYARHPGQLSMLPARVSAYPTKIIDAIGALAARPDMPDEVRRLRGRASANVHLWAAQWLLQECALLDESRRHLTCALDYAPEPGWLATMAWNCIRLLLAGNGAEEVLGWLAILDARGVRIVGSDYARALAYHQLARDADAAAAEAAVHDEAHPTALLQLIPALVRTLEKGDRAALAATALDVFWRLAARAPRTYLGLGLVLSELERYPDALRAIEGHIAAFPADAAGPDIRAQLQILTCVARPEVRAALGPAAGAPLPQREVVRVADIVWRAVREPEIVTRMSPAGTAIVTRTAGAVVEAARQAGFSGLMARLEAVLQALGCRSGAATPAA